MKHTALSATHVVIYPDKPGGEEMIKVRLQGTKEDMAWLEEVLQAVPQVQITESSEIYGNKGTNRFFRKYLEIEKSKENEE